MYSRSRQEILLKEYTETGEVCRQNERLTRTGFYLYFLVATAIVGFTYRDGTDKTIVNILNFAGLLASIITLNVIRRLQLYYRSYITTAKEIEAALGMRLYRKGKLDVDNSGTITQSNKYAYNTFIGFSALYFLYALVSGLTSIRIDATPFVVSAVGWGE